MLSFESEIKPLFRRRDRWSMKRWFDLWKVDDVRTHSAAILQHIEAGDMPCDGAWPAERVELFRRWMQEGMAP